MATTVSGFDAAFKQVWAAELAGWLDDERKTIGRQFFIPIRRKPWWEDVAKTRAERSKSMADLLDEVYA